VTLASAPGQGSTVFILLPAVGGVAASETAVRGNPVPTRSGNGTVLVVEDDPDVLRLAVETLKSLDYRVLTAGDGPSALAVLRRSAEVDFLFSDVVMPRGMSGVELAREATRLRPALRVVLASGYARSMSADERSSDFAFIGKPYRGSDLVRIFQAMKT